MTKNCLFAAALVSVALWTGCAKGLGSTPSVTVHNDNGKDDISVLYVTQTVPFTATVTGTNNTAVNWSLSGKACTGSGNPCGRIDSNGVYTAPATAPSPGAVTVIATSQADRSGQGQFQITVVPVKVSVTPTPVEVGQGLVQQLTAVAIPDNAPQTFTWAVTCVGGTACGTLVQDPNVSGLAVYTAPAAPPTGCTFASCVTVTATSTIDATGIGTAKTTVLQSRFAGTYTFRFAGYDNVNHPVAIAGSVTFGTTGAVTGGVEDVVINTGAGSVPHQYAIASGSYTPSTAGDNNTNDAGTLTLSANGGPTNTYTAVADARGSLRMIESDGNGIGSGALEKPAGAGQFNGVAQKFVFGFTGVDVNGKRVGYVGLLPMDGTATATTAGHITGGMVDSNENGVATAYSNVTGTYQAVGGVWTMSLTLGSQILDFDFYMGAGQTTTNTNNPLALYAISTHPIDASHPSLSGRMLFQDPGTTYDKTALNSGSVSHLTGVDSTGSKTMVSLLSATGDGNGNLNQNFDSNNAGAIVQAAGQPATCTYTADTNKTGRYVVTLLGTGSSCTGGLPYVFYASGTNRGFLLDQSSAAVMAGGMDPQTAPNGGFAPSELPSTYVAGTVSNATSGVIPVAANLLLTSPGNQKYNVSGTQYPGQMAVTGTYTLTLTGTGTIALTAPSANYVIYATDPSHFEMIDVDKTVTNASVIFAQQ